MPLDFPIQLNENELDRNKIDILNKILSTLKNSEKDGEDREADIENLDVSIDQLTGALTGKNPVAVQFDQTKFGRFASLPKSKLKEAVESLINEAKKKKAKKKDNRPIGKPMRSSSGGKAYKVYVKDPKTKKVKTVRFGSGGLRAKINDSKARKAFAARHKCSQKKDRTKASYWSCRLPRYAKLLGLKSSFSGFW